MERGNSAEAVLIFVHGLGGHGISSWGFDDPNSSWTSELTAKFNNLSIFSVTYRNSASYWKGAAMPLSRRALNVAATLKNALPSDKPIIFVCHSYGGLLVKQIIKLACEEEQFADLNANIKGLSFLGTPHQGAVLANLLHKTGILGRPTAAVEDLKKDNVNILDLNKWFLKHCRTSDISILNFSESAPTFGVRVVSESSSDSGLMDVLTIPIDCDHFDLCKTSSAIDPRITYLLPLIDKVINVGNKSKSELIDVEINNIILCLNDIELCLVEGKGIGSLFSKINAMTPKMGNLKSNILNDVIFKLKKYDEIQSGIGQAIARRTYSKSHNMPELIQSAISDLRGKQI